MSDPKKAEPDEDLLEFLGGIDEINEDSREGDFAEYLADLDLAKAADQVKKPAEEKIRE